MERSWWRPGHRDLYVTAVTAVSMIRAPSPARFQPVGPQLSSHPKIAALHLMPQATSSPYTPWQDSFSPPMPMPAAPLPPTHQQPTSQMAAPSLTTDVLPSAMPAYPSGRLCLHQWMADLRRPTRCHQQLEASTATTFQNVWLRYTVSYLHFHQSSHVRYISSHHATTRISPWQRTPLGSSTPRSRWRWNPPWITRSWFLACPSSASSWTPQMDIDPHMGSRDSVDATPIPEYGRHHAGDPVLWQQARSLNMVQRITCSQNYKLARCNKLHSLTWTATIVYWVCQVDLDVPGRSS